MDLTKFARKIPLEVRFFALKLQNLDFIASQISCNVQIVHPGYQKAKLKIIKGALCGMIGGILHRSLFLSIAILVGQSKIF